MIDVTKTKTEAFSISWDENDPKESILNTYTQDDFKALIQNYLDKTQAEQDYAELNEVKTQRSLETNLRAKATSPKRQKKTTTTSGTTRQTRKSKSSVSIKPPTRSRDLSLFPHKAFPYRIEIKSEKRVAWFQ